MKNLPFRLSLLLPMIAVLSCLALSGAGSEGDAAGSRPNVILIYADDHGFGDLGVYGGDDLHTPHIDALADRGMRFTQMYAPSPVCSPSRAGLLTGRYPHHAGVPGNASGPPFQGIDDGRSGRGLSNELPTISSVMQDAGYATALIGKWHLGYAPNHRPDAHGFDHWFGHLGGCIDNYSHFYFWSGPNRHDLWRNGERIREDGRYFPDLMVEEAERFIHAHRDEPFFIYYAVNTPHYPYQADPHWVERYRKAGVAYPRNLYGAFVSAQDERIGRLMKTIDELHLRERTVVIFQSDHGYSREERAHFGGGSAGPYRGSKFSLFEGGIRVPSIISWPGAIPEGEVRDQMVHGTDWLPTLAELAGIELPGMILDGASIVDVISSSSAESPHKILHWKFGNQWVVRRGSWKLYVNASDPERNDTLSQRDRQTFLVNLDQDPGEQANLAEEHPDIVKELMEQRLDWQR